MFDKIDKKTLIYVGVGVVLLILISYAIWYFTRGEKFQETPQLAFGSEKPYTFRMFYVDWCGYCKQAKPEFQPMVGTAKINNKPVEIVMVNADDQSDLAKQFGVQGFPTFVLTKPDGTNSLYNGQRKGSDFTDFLNKNVL